MRVGKNNKKNYSIYHLLYIDCTIIAMRKQQTLGGYVNSESIVPDTTLSQRLREHKHCSRISLTNIDGITFPVYSIPPSKRRLDWTHVKCAGLHNIIKNVFSGGSERSYDSRAYSSSSKKVGISVHQQIQHIVRCNRTGTCSCGIKRFKLSKLAKVVLDFAKDADIELIDSEVPICFPDANIITWIDLIGHRSKDPNRVVKISLKTGWSQHWKSDSNGFYFTGLEEEMIRSDTLNVHHMQNLCEDLILMREYGETSFESLTLYVYKIKNKLNEQKNDYVYKVSNYPTWCLTVAVREKIKKLLTWNGDS